MKFLFFLATTALHATAFNRAHFGTPKLICKTSPLFISKKTLSWFSLRETNKDPSIFRLSLSEEPKDAEIIDKAQASRSANKNQSSILENIDNLGLSLKPRAYDARNVAKTQTETSKRIMYTVKACVYLSLFIFYRAYRGLFVILPAVFREVFRKIKAAVDSPFDDNDDESALAKKGEKLRPNTAILVSILAGILTLSYVISGGFKVLMMFLRTATRTSSVEPAFEAAADEMVANEEKLKKLSVNRKKINGENN